MPNQEEPAPGSTPEPVVTITVTRQMLTDVLRDRGGDAADLTDELWARIADDLSGEIGNMTDSLLEDKAADICEGVESSDEDVHAQALEVRRSMSAAMHRAFG